MNTTTTTMMVDGARRSGTTMMINLQHQDSISGSSSSVSPTTITVAAAIGLSCQCCFSDDRNKDNGVNPQRRRSCRRRANLLSRRRFGMGRTTIGLLTPYNTLYLLLVVFLSLVQHRHAPCCAATTAAASIDVASTITMQPPQPQSTPQHRQQLDDPPSASRTTNNSDDDDDDDERDEDGLSSSTTTTTTTTTTTALPAPQQPQPQDERRSRHELNAALKRCDDAVDRIRFILRYAQQHKLRVVQTTSFGIQSALMLQLLALATTADAENNGDVPLITNSNHTTTTTTTTNNVPVIFIDTGYLHPETYRYAEQLKARYGLDLHVYQSEISPARMEALYGKLWQANHDDDRAATAHRQYNTMRKVIPMETALHDLQADIILTGLRAVQTNHRRHHVSYVNLDRPQRKSQQPSSLQPEESSHHYAPRWKVCPILDWEDDTVDAFFTKYDLPPHPLYDQGYRTVGDWHSSARYDPNVHATIRDSRFHGQTQECGLHTAITIRDDDDDDDDEDENDGASLPGASRTNVPQTIVTQRELLLSSLDTSSSSSSWDHSSLSHHNNTNNNNNNNNNNNDDVKNNDTNTTTTSTKTIVEDEDGFVVYGRSGCKYCRAAQQLLADVAAHIDVGVAVTFVEVGKDISPEELVQRLASAVSSMDDRGSGCGDNHNNATTTTIRTVPQIVYRGRRIGGYTDLVSWGAVHYAAADSSSSSSSSAASRTSFVELSRAIVVDQV
jgi:phosphoadenosine phosphosulfate reductase